MRAFARRPSSSFFRNRAQIERIIRFSELIDRGAKLPLIDEAHPKGDLFGASDLGTLTTLERTDKLGGLEEAVGSAGIEPGVPSAHELHVQLAVFKIGLVDVGDLEFSTSRWLNVCCDVHDLVIVEIETRDRPVRF